MRSILFVGCLIVSNSRDAAGAMLSEIGQDRHHSRLSLACRLNLELVQSWAELAACAARSLQKKCFVRQGMHGRSKRPQSREGEAQDERFKRSFRPRSRSR